MRENRDTSHYTICIFVYKDCIKKETEDQKGTAFFKSQMKSEQGNMKEKIMHEWQLLKGWHSPCVCACS